MSIMGSTGRVTTFPICLGLSQFLHWTSQQTGAGDCPAHKKALLARYTVSSGSICLAGLWFWGNPIYNGYDDHALNLMLAPMLSFVLYDSEVSWIMSFSVWNWEVVSSSNCELFFCVYNLFPFIPACKSALLSPQIQPSATNTWY